MSRIPHLLSIVSLVALGASAGCDPGGAYCQRFFDCREDEQDLDDDYVATCVESDRAFDDVLAANEEEDCSDLRAAKNAYYACMAGLECKDFNDEIDEGPDECESEAEDFAEAAQDASNDCFVNTSPTGEQ